MLLTNLINAVSAAVKKSGPECTSRLFKTKAATLLMSLRNSSKLPVSFSKETFVLLERIKETLALKDKENHSRTAASQELVLIELMELMHELINSLTARQGKSQAQPKSTALGSVRQRQRDIERAPIAANLSKQVTSIKRDIEQAKRLIKESSPSKRLEMVALQFKKAEGSCTNLWTRVKLREEYNKTIERIEEYKRESQLLADIVNEYSKDTKRSCRIKPEEVKRIVEAGKKLHVVLVEQFDKLQMLKAEHKKMWESELQAIVKEQESLNHQLAEFPVYEQDNDQLLRAIITLDKNHRDSFSKKSTKPNLNVIEPENIDRYVREAVLDGIRASTGQESSAERLSAIQKYEKIRKWSFVQ